MFFLLKEGVFLFPVANSRIEAWVYQRGGVWQASLSRTEYKSQMTMNVPIKTLTFTQIPSFQFTEWQSGPIKQRQSANKWNESKLYILCGSPKCLFSNLKLYKLCKYMFVRHALLVINCCTGSRQQNSSTITDWQNINKKAMLQLNAMDKHNTHVHHLRRW